MKYFILFTIILVILKLIEQLHYKYSKHNYSRFGYKQNELTYALWYSYSRLYYLIISLILICHFIKWLIRYN